MPAIMNDDTISGNPLRARCHTDRQVHTRENKSDPLQNMIHCKHRNEQEVRTVSSGIRDNTRSTPYYLGRLSVYASSQSNRAQSSRQIVVVAVGIRVPRYPNTSYWDRHWILVQVLGQIALRVHLD